MNDLEIEQAWAHNIYDNCLSTYPDIDSGYVVDLTGRNVLSKDEYKKAGFRILNCRRPGCWAIYCENKGQLNLFIMWFGSDSIDTIYEI